MLVLVVHVMVAAEGQVWSKSLSSPASYMGTFGHYREHAIARSHTVASPEPSAGVSYTFTSSKSIIGGGRS